MANQLFKLKFNRIDHIYKSLQQACYKQAGSSTLGNKLVCDYWTAFWQAEHTQKKTMAKKDVKQKHYNVDRNVTTRYGLHRLDMLANLMIVLL